MFRNIPGCSMFHVLSTAHLVTTNYSSCNQLFAQGFTYIFYFQAQLTCNLRSEHWLAIPAETSELQKTQVSWDLTQTDCKYVQNITMFTVSANFNQLLIGLGFNRSESDGERVMIVVERNNSKHIFTFNPSWFLAYVQNIRKKAGELSKVLFVLDVTQTNL